MFVPFVEAMVLPVSNLEMFVVGASSISAQTTKWLNVLFAMLVFLGFAHLGYGDFWGFVLDTLFGLLGYLTFKRLQLSTIAFFCFLCAFNAGIDLVASINLVFSVAKSTPEELFSLSESLNIEEWQLIFAAIVLTLDAVIMLVCLVLSCKVYSDLRSNVYAQIGLMTTQPLISRSNNEPHAAFQPFQGRPHRISQPGTPV